MVSCNEWLWARNNDGYGTLRYQGKPGVLAHRVAYCMAQGITLESIKGIIVRHTCDNPGCTNADHLILGTRQDNSTDMVERGRSAKGFLLPVTKLSDRQVKEIRYKRAYGCRLSTLSKEYDVSEQQISRICRYEQRKDS